MELKQQLELVEVQYEGSKAILIFLDEEEGVIREVNFNKQIYNNEDKKWVDDPAKAEQVEKWCEEYFKCSFDELKNQTGVRKDVYVYDNYCSLWESNEVSKFSEDMVGEVFEVEIKEAFIDDIAIRFRFEYESKTYESKMVFAKYLESLKKYIPNPIEKKKKIESFEDKFGLSIDEIEKLIGRTVLVEIKKAMGKYVYVEIKKNNNKKNKKK